MAPVQPQVRRDAAQRRRRLPRGGLSGGHVLRAASNKANEAAALRLLGQPPRIRMRNVWSGRSLLLSGSSSTEARRRVCARGDSPTRGAGARSSASQSRSSKTYIM
jgi:hypothetical protein